MLRLRVYAREPIAAKFNFLLRRFFVFCLVIIFFVFYLFFSWLRTERRARWLVLNSVYQFFVMRIYVAGKLDGIFCCCKPRLMVDELYRLRSFPWWGSLFREINYKLVQLCWAQSMTSSWTHSLERRDYNFKHSPRGVSLAALVKAWLTVMRETLEIRDHSANFKPRSPTNSLWWQLEFKRRSPLFFLSI